MTGHAARGHSEWSASATSRNWNCPGALTLIQTMPVEDKESEAAAWGTACHQVAERCLMLDVDADAFLNTVEQTKERAINVDEELAECAQVYVDYVRAAKVGEGKKLYVETRFDLASLGTPFEAGGTADAVVYHQDEKRLEVIDLKGGRGVVVEAKGNPQLRTYALGAMMAFPQLTSHSVTVTIVQPRAPHKDGRIRSETFSVGELVEWTSDLLDAMRRSARARDAYTETPRAAWAQEWLAAGDHCKFCPAAALCPALEQKTMDAVGIWFDAIDQPHIANQPDQLSPEELARRLDMLDMIEGWISAVRAYAHTQAEIGVTIPGYRLVDKQARRKWAADEEKVAADLVNVFGLSEDAIFDRKLKTPAQVEKLVGSKRKGELGNMWHQPVTGTNLVAEAKTTRPAAQSLVDKFITKIED